MAIDKSFARRKLTAAFVKECISAVDSNLSGTPRIHSVPNSLRRLFLVSHPSEGDSIKTDLRAGFMKTVRFSRQYFTDGRSFFFNAQNLQSFYLLLSFSPERIATEIAITMRAIMIISYRIANRQ